MNITLCTLNTKNMHNIKKNQNIALIMIAKTLKKIPQNRKKYPSLFKYQICKFEQTHTHAFTCKYTSTDITHIHTHQPPTHTPTFHSSSNPPPPYTQKKK